MAPAHGQAEEGRDEGEKAEQRRREGGIDEGMDEERRPGISGCGPPSFYL